MQYARMSGLLVKHLPVKGLGFVELPGLVLLSGGFESLLDHFSSHETQPGILPWGNPRRYN
jgi:hypothetical protein